MWDGRGGLAEWRKEVQAGRKAEAAYRRALELMNDDHLPTIDWYVRTATEAIQDLER